MPYFAQEPLSYLTLPTIRNAYKTFSIMVNFRPDNVDGERLQADSFCLLHFPDSSLVSYCLCRVSTCLLSLRLVSSPLSLTSLGGKVSYCTPVSLNAWNRKSSVTLTVLSRRSIRPSHDASQLSKRRCMAFLHPARLRGQGRDNEQDKWSRKIVRC